MSAEITCKYNYLQTYNQGKIQIPYSSETLANHSSLSLLQNVDDNFFAFNIQDVISKNEGVAGDHQEVLQIGSNATDMFEKVYHYSGTMYDNYIRIRLIRNLQPVANYQTAYSSSQWTANSKYYMFLGADGPLDSWCQCGRDDAFNDHEFEVGGWSGSPGSTSDIQFVLSVLQEIIDPYATSDTDDTDTDDTGFGDYDYSGDDTDFSPLPTISATQTGLCTLYRVDKTDIQGLASYLWGLGSIASFLPIYTSPIDCIMFLGIVPIEPNQESAGSYITIGNLPTTVMAKKVTDQFMSLNMGSITIGKGKFTNTFMDYSPYVSAELQLPYIGTVKLSIDEIMDATLELNYNIDLLSGSCVAELKVVKTFKYGDSSHTHTNVLYSYCGNILTTIPITGQSFAQMFNAVIGAVATGIGGNASAAMAKNPTMVNAIKQQTVASEIGSTSAMKPDIKRGGNISSSSGLMGNQKARLILSLPKLCRANQQAHEVGYPKYQRYQLSSLKGYTKIFEVHVNGVPCTDTERQMIEQSLTGGVIFSNTPVPTQTAGNNTVLIYSQECEKIQINKADNWTLIDTISGSWKDDEIDILNPSIVLEATTDLTYSKILTEANYVYIGDFGRYYYINKITAMKGNLFKLSLTIDPCMSWLSYILDLYAIVDRQELKYNLYLSDSFVRTYNNPYTTVYEFPTGFSGYAYILAVAGDN